MSSCSWKMVSKEYISACFIAQMVIVLLGSYSPELLCNKNSRGTVLGTLSICACECVCVHAHVYARMHTCTHTQRAKSEQMDAPKNQRRDPSSSFIGQKKGCCQHPLKTSGIPNVPSMPTAALPDLVSHLSPTNHASHWPPRHSSYLSHLHGQTSKTNCAALLLKNFWCFSLSWG